MNKSKLNEPDVEQTTTGQPIHIDMSDERIKDAVFLPYMETKEFKPMQPDPTLKEENQKLKEENQKLKKENQKLKKLIKDKKTPKKIVYEKSPTYNNVAFLMPKCPNCNTTILNKHKHCHNCGQKLDWSDEDVEGKR